jgi:hypothetical protein
LPRTGRPVALEISRSGNGAHAWVFFSSAVAARDCGRLGTAIISHTCARTRQLKLTSYDRLFPNQDTMPKGGFGNLIALPLQKVPREWRQRVRRTMHCGCIPTNGPSWRRYSPWQPTILSRRSCGPPAAHPLDVTFITEEDQQEPWKRTAPARKRLPGPMPESLTVTSANLLYFDKGQLPQALANRLIRLRPFRIPSSTKRRRCACRYGMSRG